MTKFLKFLALTGIMGVITSCGYSQSHARVYAFSDEKGKGWLGVEVQDVTKILKEKKSLSVTNGAYVTDVTEDSPAEKAELKEGDVIVKLDGNKIEDGNDLIDEVRSHKPKSEVKVEIVRKGESKTLTVTLGRVPNTMSYGFNDIRIPRAPRMPRMPRLPSLPRMPRTPSAPHVYFMQQDKNGLEVQSLGRQLAEYLEVTDNYGVLVSGVKKGSSAETAGFKAGDVIQKIDGRKIKNVESLTDALSDNEGSNLNCDVVRKGKSLSLKWHVEAEEMDESDDDYSFESYTPEQSPDAGNEKLHRLFFHSPKLDQLKERLDLLRHQLHERMQELKVKLNERISSVWETMRRSFT